MQIDLTRLKSYDSQLHAELRILTGSSDGWHIVDADCLLVPMRLRLENFLRLQTQTLSEPAVQSVDESSRDYVPPASKEDYFAYVQEDMDRAAGTTQLEFYQKQGLIEDQHNFDLIASYFKDRGLALSVASVDRLVADLKSHLHWNTTTVAAPPPPAAPPAPPPAAEVLGVLPTGERQLPIDADARTMKAASVAQLRDLDKRRAGRRRPAHSFGSKF